MVHSALPTLYYLEGENMLQSYADLVLTGGRVTLRPMREEDAEFIIKWRNDPKIHKWLFSNDTITLQSHLEWFRNRKPNRLDFVICLLDSELPIGTVSYTNIDFENRKAEAGKMLGDRTQWGQGLATEAYRLWIVFGFENLGLYYIYTQTLSTNLKNIRLNERLGFRIEKVLHEKYRRTDQLFDIVVMRLDREGARRPGTMEVK